MINEWVSVSRANRTIERFLGMEPFLQVRIRCELAEMKSMSIYLFVTQNALSPLEPFFHSAFIIEHLSFHFVKNRFRKVRNYSSTTLERRNRCLGQVVCRTNLHPDAGKHLSQDQHLLGTNGTILPHHRTALLSILAHNG